MPLPALRPINHNHLKRRAETEQRQRQLEQGEIRHRFQWATWSSALPNGRTFVSSWTAARALAEELESKGHQAYVDCTEVWR